MQEISPMMVMTPDEQLETAVRFGQVSIKLAAITLAAGAMLAPQQLSPEPTYRTAVVAGIEVPQTLLPEPTVTECPAPSQQAIRAVRKLIMGKSPEATDFSLFYTNRAAFAKKSGVTVDEANNTTLQKLYDADMNVAPFKNYFSFAQQLFKQDGVTLRYATRADFKDDPHWKSHVPVPAELENPVAKLDILRVVDTLFTMPKEYVAFSGLKQVVVTRHLDAAANAETGGDHSRINIDLASAFDGPSGILNHETGHLVQTAMCGGSDNVVHDPTYTAFNKGIPYKIQNPTFNMQPVSATDRMQDWSVALSKNGITKDDYSSLSRFLAAWNRKCQAFDAWQSQNENVVFTDGYGATDKAEDEAQVLGALTQGFRQQIFDPEFPALNQKATIDLARLLQYGQVKTVEYLIKIMKIQGTIPATNHEDAPDACTLDGAERTKQLVKDFNSYKASWTNH